MQTMYYIGLDVHKRTISYCVKDGSGVIDAEGTLPATRLDLDRWMKNTSAAWTAAMKATVFTGSIGNRSHGREANRRDEGSKRIYTRAPPKRVRRAFAS